MTSRKRPSAQNGATIPNEPIDEVRTEPQTGLHAASKPPSGRLALAALWIVVIAGCASMVSSGFIEHGRHAHLFLSAGMVCAGIGCLGLMVTAIRLSDPASLKAVPPAEALEKQPDEPAAVQEAELPQAPQMPSRSEGTITLHGHVWGQTSIPIASVVVAPQDAQTMPASIPAFEPADQSAEADEPFTLVRENAQRAAPAIEGLSSFGKPDSSGVHTLVTLSMRDKKDRSSETASPRTEVDAVLFDRLDEYKLHKPDEGCVLLITQTITPNTETTALVPRLNGATAALNLARTAAAVHGLSTLIIDAGSLAWSRYSPADWTRGPAPDVVDLPRVPGVFDILAGKADFDDWLLVDDETPTLSALAPGEIPADWQAALSSDAMRELVARARKEADVVILYAPNIQEHPEAVQSLGALANGILLVSGSGARGSADELAAMDLLPEGTVVLGRISLGDEPAEPAPAGSQKVPSPEAAQPGTSEQSDGATPEPGPHPADANRNGAEEAHAAPAGGDTPARRKPAAQRSNPRRAKNAEATRYATPTSRARSRRLQRRSRTG